MTLDELGQGEKAIITKVKGRGAFRKRIIEMGFVLGKPITVIKKAPLKDPVEYAIMGYNVSLRNSEARLIEIVTESEIRKLKRLEYNGTIDEHILKKTAHRMGKTINVAFVGNPNSGKTSLFNHASGAKEKVGNYSGVTIDAKEAKFSLNGYVFNVVDLPGTYSITAYTPEELYVRNYIFDKVPDIVVNVVDAGNLERNLYLTTQLIDMDIKVVVALNMYDELQKNGDQLNHEFLGKMLGIPFIPTVGSKGKGIHQLLEKLIDVYEDQDETVRHVHVNYGKCIERSIKSIQDSINQPGNFFLTDKISPRFLSIKLLEKDSATQERVEQAKNHKLLNHKVHHEIKRIESSLSEDSETAITDAKYAFISGALKETLVPARIKRIRKTEILDNFITHKFWGIPIFIVFMWLTFFVTFKVGQIPMDYIEMGVANLSQYLHQHMPSGMLKDLFVDGIIGGVGGVIVFLPNIILLYFFISLLEDTGYMARAVFIMDRLMHKIGLHGKSFIPMLMGFGCNVPAIMATRIIESRRDRIMTMLITPFMSCGARLPVYILFITAFFSHHQASILFLMYFMGIGVAILTSLLLSKTMFRQIDVPFVMELPPYRIPSVRSLFKHMWMSAQQYLQKIAGVILVASILIWALGYFPREVEFTRDYKSEIEQIETHYHQASNSGLTVQSESRSLEKQKNQQIHDLQLLMRAEQQENSYIGRIGKFITPVMTPLGFDWKMSVGLLAGVAAKEVVIGTMGVLYQADQDDKANTALVDKLRNYKYLDGPHKGEAVFTPLIALSYMIFVLIYFPCIAVISTIKKESGKWKYSIFEIVYTTSLAWILSFVVFQVGQMIL